jgi:hypothetical protein
MLLGKQYKVPFVVRMWNVQAMLGGYKDCSKGSSLLAYRCFGMAYCCAFVNKCRGVLP